MMYRNGGWIVIECDSCGLKRKDHEWRPYNKAWAEAVAAGWKAIAIRDGRDFARQCGECSALGAEIKIDQARKIV